MKDKNYRAINDLDENLDIEGFAEEEEEEAEAMNAANDSLTNDDTKRSEARHRIEDLEEKKRLRKLLDDYYGDDEDF